MANTTNLGLPLMAAAQSQKHITHNDALLSLDALVQLAVKSMTLTAPPGSPAESDRYIVGSGATGAWAGKDLNFTYYTSGAWVFMAPRDGWLAWDMETESTYVWQTEAWLLQSLVISNFGTSVGIGDAIANATRRLAVNSTEALFNHDGSSVSIYVNKNTMANDAGFTLQTAFSSRALFGLLGDDHFTIKTTPNGSTYKTGLIVSKDTAAVQLVEHPKFSCYCNFGNTYAAGWLDMQANIARHNDQGDLAIASNVATFTAPHDGYYMFGAGATLETGGTPTAWQLGLSVNNATPASDTISNSGGDATFTTLESGMSTTALLKLTAGQTVKAKLNITGGGRVVADRNYFWGCQIA